MYVLLIFIVCIQNSRNYCISNCVIVITLENLSPVNKSIKRKGATRDLTFDSGVTNPLLFLADFEKCEDVMTPDEKLEKIRHFVDEEHKGKNVDYV